MSGLGVAIPTPRLKQPSKAIGTVKSTTTLKTAFATLAFLPGALAGCSSPADPADPMGTTTTGAGPVTSGGMGGATSAGSTGATTSPATTSPSTTSSVTSTTGAQVGCLATALADGSLDLQINPAHNYAFDSTVTLNVLKVAPNTPLHFDWSGLTTDITQQPIGPGEVVTVLFTLLDLTSEDFQTKLNANERLNGFSKGAIAFYPTTETSADIYEFSAPGNTEPLPASDIDPYLDPEVFPPEAHTYAVLVQDSTDPAHGVRMVQALQLDPESVNTEVLITNESSGLTYETDLTAVVPLQVPAANANITTDWKAVEGGLNGLGDVWEERAVNEVMIGHYSLTPEQLTEQFLGLDNIADELYRGVVTAGSKLNLNTLTEETTAAPFPGIDGTGTWILALNCSDCTNPAPWFLTILQPCQ